MNTLSLAVFKAGKRERIVLSNSFVAFLTDKTLWLVHDDTLVFTQRSVIDQFDPAMTM